MATIGLSPPSFEKPLHRIYRERGNEEGSPERFGLTRVGDVQLLQGLNKEVKPISRQEAGILTAAVEAQSQPNDEDLTYMTRDFVQCTLPHSDPGQVPFWTRTNGNLTLSITSDYDPQTGALVPLRKHSTSSPLLAHHRSASHRQPRLELGKTYSSFFARPWT